MNRISRILIAAAIVASTAGAATAQSFSSGWGTGNVQPSHYDFAGKLVSDRAQHNPVARSDRAYEGLSAYAAAPVGEGGALAPSSGSSAGYNQLLATH